MIECLPCIYKVLSQSLTVKKINLKLKRFFSSMKQRKGSEVILVESLYSPGILIQIIPKSQLVSGVEERGPSAVTVPIANH